MNQTTLTIHCEYSENEQTLEELIRTSFDTFLKKELSALTIS